METKYKEMYRREVVKNKNLIGDYKDLFMENAGNILLVKLLNVAIKDLKNELNDTYEEIEKLKEQIAEKDERINSLQDHLFMGKPLEIVRVCEDESYEKKEADNS